MAIADCSTGAPIVIPRWTIQEDWHQVVSEAKTGKLTLSESTFWVSRYQTGHPSVYGNVHVHINAGKVEFEGRDGVMASLKSDNSNSCRVWLPNNERTSDSVTILSPRRRFQPFGDKKQINALDVSPEGELVVIGADDGGLQVAESQSGTLRRRLDGHVGDVLTTQFYPSGKVILSGGSDMQLRIWSVDDGSCPRVLKGHRGAVLGTAMIDRGQNILSCSRDGTVRMWDCGLGSTVTTYQPLSSFGAINKISLIGDRSLVICACEDGRVRGFDHGSQQETFISSASPGAAVECITTFPNANYIASGSHDGTLTIFDLRNMSNPWLRLRRSDSPIWSLAASPSPSCLNLIMASGDGSCCEVECSNSVEMTETLTPFVRKEFVISANEPVFTTKMTNTNVYCGNRRGYFDCFAV